MHFNRESVLEELDDFENKHDEVPPILEEYLEMVAKTGDIVFPWCKLKPLLKRKMDLVITEFSKSCPLDTIPSLPNTEPFDYEGLKTNMLEAVDTFQNAPFTIQRLCELITDPKKHYNRTDKYMRGLEKNLLVVTTIEPGNNSAANRNQPVMVNGSVSNSSDSMNQEIGFDSDVPEDDSPPPVNGTVLENFETVFPSANRIGNASNGIQVTMVTGANVYQASEDVANFEYASDSTSDMNENGVFHNIGETTDANMTPTPVTFDDDGIVKTFVEETVNHVMQSFAVEEGCQTDVSHIKDEQEEDYVACEAISDNDIETEDNDEPNAKRQKIEHDEETITDAARETASVDISEETTSLQISAEHDVTDISEEARTMHVSTENADSDMSEETIDIDISAETTAIVISKVTSITDTCGETTSMVISKETAVTYTSGETTGTDISEKIAVTCMSEETAGTYISEKITDTYMSEETTGTDVSEKTAAIDISEDSVVTGIPENTHSADVSGETAVTDVSEETAVVDVSEKTSITNTSEDTAIVDVCEKDSVADIVDKVTTDSETNKIENEESTVENVSEAVATEITSDETEEVDNDIPMAAEDKVCEENQVNTSIIDEQPAQVDIKEDENSNDVVDCEKMEIEDTE